MSLGSVIGSIAAPVSQAGGALGSIWNAIGYNPIASYQAQHDFNKQADLQRELTQMQYRLSHDNWEKQFDKESAYNTPSMQRQRMEQAGFNPFVSQAADNGTINMPAQAGAGGATVNPVPNYIESYSKAALAGLQGIHQGLVNDKTKDMLNATLQNILADSANKDAETQYRQIMTDIERQYGKMMKRKELNKLQAEIQEITARAVKEDSEGKYFDAAAWLADAQTVMSTALGKKYDSEKQLIDKDLESYKQRLITTLALQRAQTQEAHASASNQSEQAQTEREIRVPKVDAEKARAAILRTQSIVDKETRLSRIHKILAESSVTPQVLKEELNLAHAESNLVYWKFLVNAISSLVSAGGMLMLGSSSLLKGLKGVKPPVGSIPSGSKLYDQKGNLIITTQDVPKITTY